MKAVRKMSDYPKDWEEVELGEYNLITSSKRVFEKEWKKRGVPFFRTRDIVSFHSKEEQNDKLFISEETYRNKVTVSGAPHKGDLLVTGVGSIGIPFLIENDNKIYFKDGNIIWIKKGDFFHPKYLYYLFLTSKIKNQILNYSGFTTVGTFTIKNAKKLRIPKISLKEQKSIADTLMTFDKHIENLEKLIEKKKIIRDGAVEDLMTGKTRLYGFDGEWEKVTILDLMSPYGGLSGKSSKDFKDGNKKYISYLKVFNNLYIEKVDTKVIIKKNEMQNAVNKGDIIFTQSSETLDEVGMASTYLGEEEVYLNSFCFGIRKKREFNSVFMVLLLRSEEIRKKISTEGQGSTRYNLSPNRLMNIELLIPSLKEQEAIADILTSMDEEIENLEKEKTKIEKIRAGAMDDLLTGKVRLV